MPDQKELSPLGAELVEAMQEVAAHVRGEISLPVRRVEAPERIDVAGIRSKLGLSQGEFAARFGFSRRTVQDWEQGRRRPEGPARVLLTIIDRKPEAVLDALAGGWEHDTIDPR
jgi:putative transcriptional regulator